MNSIHIRAYKERFDCLVIGAGIAGVCAALYIQQSGAKVAIVDPFPPGSGDSFGNAGIIAAKNLLPLSSGKTLRNLYPLLVDSGSPLFMRWSKVLGIIPWFLQMLRYSTQIEVNRITKALADLAAENGQAYGQLLSEISAKDLVISKGWLSLYRSEEELNAYWNYDSKLLRLYGAQMERLSSSEILQLAPGVNIKKYPYGIYYPDARHSPNPQRLVTKLFDLFMSRGGNHIKERVMELKRTGSIIDAAETKRQLLVADHYVIAAGTASAAFSRMVGEKVPHQSVGGYHVFVEDQKFELDLPLVPMDFRFSITPLTRGIRLAGIYEFGGHSLRPDKKIPKRMLKHAQQVLPGLNGKKFQSWHGARSHMPDSLPVISKSKTVKNVVYVFGLASFGMIFGAISGLLVSQLLQNRQTVIDVSPYSIDRFSLLSNRIAGSETSPQSDTRS